MGAEEEREAEDEEEHGQAREVGWSLAMKASLNGERGRLLPDIASSGYITG
jgi:hypothetical protein